MLSNPCSHAQEVCCAVCVTWATISCKALTPPLQAQATVMSAACCRVLATRTPSVKASFTSSIERLRTRGAETVQERLRLAWRACILIPGHVRRNAVRDLQHRCWHWFMGLCGIYQTWFQRPDPLRCPPAQRSTCLHSSGC